ncbi:toxin-antitoxin system YwqK family antitoxin [Hymenobacter arizonensis]|uniref:toxin-antitoxin system YwqK family antitoxin n=1 Tax=Hymenobacter arizonensis TaxID=1227077 RepID=UPI001F186FA6|nr:hypothetical protein [Hymenobacter arizonensis]
MVVTSGGCAQEKAASVEKTYYPDGTPEWVATRKNGHLHGRSVLYYPNGTIEAEAHWVEGQRTGKTRRFYRHGKLAQTAQYVRGTLTGPVLHYDSITGQPVERQVYDAQGRLVYLNSYDPDGRPSSRGLQSIMEAPDTIGRGGVYAGCLRFGYPLTGQVRLIVGTLVTRPEALERYHIQDTVAVIAPDARGRFCFAYRLPPGAQGRQLFGYQFRHSGSAYDSLSVERLSGTKQFFVK